jgi:hypothetical protein
VLIANIYKGVVPSLVYDERPSPSLKYVTSFRVFQEPSPNLRLDANKTLAATGALDVIQCNREPMDDCVFHEGELRGSKRF